MIVRPLDSNGDMVPVYDESQMLTEDDAVIQLIKERLTFYHGEWWEDGSLGIRIPEFLIDGIRKDGIDMFARYITSYVAETEGVVGISGVSVDYNKRVLTYRCIVQTMYGNGLVEVDLSGIL